MTTQEPLEPSLIWTMYAALQGECQHFNTLESSYRTLASTWLLAALGAVGFVVKEGKPEAAPLWVAAIGAAGAIGIVLLFTLDLLVYQQLLDAAFQEQLRLERTHAWLPRVAQRMKRTQNNGATQRIVWFYVAMFAVLIALVAAGAATALASSLRGRVALGTWLFVVLAGPGCYAMLHMTRAHRRDWTIEQPGDESL